MQRKQPCSYSVSLGPLLGADGAGEEARGWGQVSGSVCCSSASTSNMSELNAPNDALPLKEIFTTLWPRKDPVDGIRDHVAGLLQQALCRDHYSATARSLFFFFFFILPLILIFLAFFNCFFY